MQSDQQVTNKVLALLNTNSGSEDSLAETLRAISQHWEDAETEVYVQLSNSREDAQEKIRRANNMGINMILCSGGDGTLNSILPALVELDIAVAFIPLGSANAFARHFNIPLEVSDAVRALKTGVNQRIDVGRANDHLFVISCSFAWETTLMDMFEKLPTRGLATHVAAVGMTAFNYRPQPQHVKFENGDRISWDEPMLLSVTNLSRYADVDLVSKRSKPDDGLLELAVVEKQNMLKLAASLRKLNEISADELDMVETFHGSHFILTRETPANIQIDGEIIENQDEVTIDVLPKALQIRVPVNG